VYVRTVQEDIQQAVHIQIGGLSRGQVFDIVLSFIA
jgi:hypothetical protein